MKQQQGLSLVELLIALTLGLFVVLAVTGLVISSKATQATQIAAANVQDTARFALANITRSSKQAGYVNFDREVAPIVSLDHLSPSVLGLDASSLNAKTHGIDSPLPSSINGSDVLALRYFGSGNPTDHTVVNCAGYGVAAPTSHDNAEEERGWSIYYVANEVGGEPALFCKYEGKTKRDGSTNFDAQAIARGVESFQVLYGIDNGASYQFLNASEITALDADIPSSDLTKKTHWKKITAIKVALLIHGEEKSRQDAIPTTHYLFGKNYKNAGDTGTQIVEANLPKAQRNRLRHVVATTIQLRNPVN